MDPVLKLLKPLDPPTPTLTCPTKVELVCVLEVFLDAVTPLLLLLLLLLATKSFLVLIWVSTIQVSSPSPSLTHLVLLLPLLASNTELVWISVSSTQISLRLLPHLVPLLPLHATKSFLVLI
jgi:hypothetical protein